MGNSNDGRQEVRVTGGGEKGMSKTCHYFSMWKPKLKVTDKTYRCANCKKEYPRDPGAAKSNTVEGLQTKMEIEERAEAERRNVRRRTR